MFVNIAKVTPKLGWEEHITNNELVIKKVEEFDLLTMMDVPFLSAPIQIQPDGSLMVDVNKFVSYGTGLSIDDVAVVETDMAWAKVSE